MRKDVVFTNKLSGNIMDWVNSYSKEQKITKRELIEKALLDYQEKIIKEKMIETCKRVAKDPEMLEMAEWGIADYADQLNKMDL